MMVDPAVTSHHVSHEGKNYYFCSAGCRAKFAADPEPYLSEDSNRPAAAQPGAIRTCPMHPQIRQDHPGPCPICGMALEPEVVTADRSEEHTSELQSLMTISYAVFCLNTNNTNRSEENKSDVTSIMTV